MTGPQHAAEVEQVVPIDPLHDHLQAYLNASRRIEEWKEVQAEARAAIEAALGEAEVGTVAGRKAVTWSRAERTSLDTKRLQADLPATVLAPYLRTTVVRTFRPVLARDE